MPTDPLSTLALATGGTFLGKFVGPAAESLGKVAWERAQQLGQKATALLTAIGRDPQLVEPKLLVPLVQAAALETDELLADKWAALLANAADPAQRVQVQPGFAGILRELTATDAKIVDRIYRQAQEQFQHRSRLPETVIVSGLVAALELSQEAFALSIDNVLRLALCRAPNGPVKMGPHTYAPEPTMFVVPTVLGAAFWRACSPPEK